MDVGGVMINIYGIYSDNILLYLGSTSRSVDTRGKEHLKDLLINKHSNKSLQKAFNNVSGNIEIKIISSIDTDNSLLKFFYECLYNSLLKPKCNRCIIQQGYNKVNLQRTSEEIAGELIKVINDLV